MFSRIFIERPVFATVLSIIIVLAGVVSIMVLPVAQYPDIVPPTVTISATYPGASAETLQQTVAAPIEEQVNGVENMIYMSSTSSNSGTVTITVSFAIGTDPDQASINVNNRVQQALATLPEPVRRQGVTVKKQSSNFLQIVTLYSPNQRYDTIYLDNYASINVVDALKRIPGVSDAKPFGAQSYSMRIWLNPDRMKQLKLTTTDIANAISAQNAQYAVGQVGAPPSATTQQLTYTVSTQGRLSEPEQFENIILRSNPDGSTLRLGDVARVEMGAYSYSVTSELNGQPAIAIGIYLQSGANALAVADGVKKAMKDVSSRFPDGVAYSIPYDTTRFVKASIHDVLKTMAEAFVLVFLVVFLFLQNWRATLIPCIAAPIALIGTFACMLALGFTINTITLLGLVLSIGLVVDDAIIVLENVERIMETEGLGAKEASIKAMREVQGPVVAIVFVLGAVFIPVAFLGGMTGQIYKQFAVTLAVSIAISGFVALTLTPALCALLLKHKRGEPMRFFRWFNRGFDWMTRRYSAGVAWMLRRSMISLVLFAVMIGVVLLLFRTVPSGFIPQEDQGVMIAAVKMPDAASLYRTEDITSKVARLEKDNPAIQDIITINGFDMLTSTTKTSAATMFFIFKPWDERSGWASSVNGQIAKLRKIAAGLDKGLVIPFNPPAIPGLGATGGFQFYVQNRGNGGSEALAKVVGKLVSAANKRPELAGVTTLFNANVPQLFLHVDRDKAQAYGVPLGDIYTSLQSTFGAYYVNDFNKYGQTYKVQLQAQAPFRSQPSDLSKVYVRSATSGEMVPLASLIDVKHVVGPESIDSFNAFPAAQITGSAAPGYSSGEALDAMEAVAAGVLPSDFSYAWSGESYEEKQSGGTSIMAFIFGIIIVFLILAAQYEKWSLPFSVILAVPFGIFGAFVATWLRGLTNDIYFQIALLTLVGLSAKNAILIVEFAVEKHREGLSLRKAAIEAATLRFRPILMTSLAFILGAVPLMVASGAGANARHSIGTGVVGGMLSATALLIFFVPLFYVLVTREKKHRAKKGEKSAGKDADR